MCDLDLLALKENEQKNNRRVTKGMKTRQGTIKKEKT